MADPVTIVGAVAASAQLAEQLGKSCFLIVKEILRARKDVKDAPKKTEDLFKLVESVDRYLNELATFTPKENEPNELVVRLREGSDPEFLKPELQELYRTLCSVRSKVTEFQADDKNRERRNKSFEGIKSLVHQGATKQKKEVEELILNLETSLSKLDKGLGVATFTKTSDTHVIVRETRDQVSVTHEYVLKLCEAVQGQRIVPDVGSSGEKMDIDEEHVNSATAEFKTDNALVKSLIEAADDDVDYDSYRVDIECKTARNDNAVWEYLQGESDAAVAAVAAGVRRQRASVVTGWPVGHEASVRFTMSVPDSRRFYFLSYAHKPGAEVELFFPKRNNAKNTMIPKEDSTPFTRIFPHRSREYPRDPPNWALKKVLGSSESSAESVFLIFSKETLVRAEAQSKKEDLEMSDVAGELAKHLDRKNEDCGYDDIIVKHFPFDIRAMK
ncbi:hypothetical protein M758_11G022300 [Ceratodon purpureus]|nr:hypothetical protein M758_11G022300 [Ceratodon purpureus]KAG0600293.1 hypothetical protein M758_11G022300 [Ceratodon purpureus]